MARLAWTEAPPRTRAGAKPRVPARSLSPVFGGPWNAGEVRGDARRVEPDETAASDSLLAPQQLVRLDGRDAGQSRECSAERWPRSAGGAAHPQVQTESSANPAGRACPERHRGGRSTRIASGRPLRIVSTTAGPSRKVRLLGLAKLRPASASARARVGRVGPPNKAFKLTRRRWRRRVAW